MHSTPTSMSSPSTSSSTSNQMTSNASRNFYTIFGRAEIVHRKLLYDLMSSVHEYILLSETETNQEVNENKSTSPQTYYNSTEWLFMRIHRCIEQIFLNGLRLFKPDKSPDTWRFIEALNWINRYMTSSLANPSSYNIESKSTIPKITRIRNDKALAWIYENLKTNSLTSKLKCLLSDSEHLVSSYEVTIAFFHSKKFIDAMFQCLNALEKRDTQILSQIDSNLYTISANAFDNNPFIINHGDQSTSRKLICDNTASSKMNKGKTLERHRKNHYKNSSDNLNRGIAERLQKHCNRIRCKCKHLISPKLRPWVSMPDIRVHNHRKERIRKISRSKSQQFFPKNVRIKLTAENIAINEKKTFGETKKMKTSKSESHTTSMEHDHLRPINLVKCDDIKIHFDRHQSTSDRSNELPSFTSPPSNCPFSVAAKSNSNLTSFIGGILPTKKNLFPFLSNTNSSASNESTSPIGGTNFVSFAPQYGEKIEKPNYRSMFDDSIESPTQFLPATIDSETMPPLTRGQSLISYLQEQQRQRFNVTDLERENAHFTLSDAIIAAIEEIKCSHNERKREKQSRISAKRKNRNRRLKMWSTSDAERLLFDDEQFSNVELEGTNSMSSLSGESSDSDSSHVSSDSNSSTTSNAGNLKRLKIFSVSSHSINDHAAYAEWTENSIQSLSAEGVALSLISKFKNRQLPKAAELLSNGPDNEYFSLYRMSDVSSDDVYETPYTRGTCDWAPPRAQIIFTRHLPPDRKKKIQLQKNLCAGCGMYVAPALQYSLRYCEYSGKYHCTGCHRNQISSIPARVIERWDFSCHPVSVFSYRLLDQIWKVPLFRVPDLNKELYDKIRALRQAHSRRILLKYIHDFIVLCRFAEDLKRELDTIPAYIYNDIEIWSMSDFSDVRNGTFLKVINEIISRGEQHIYNCELCTAHGFICEYCNDKQVIFPWQSKVKRCSICGSCSHAKCWKNQCWKCKRLEKLNKKNPK